MILNNRRWVRVTLLALASVSLAACAADASKPDSKRAMNFVTSSHVKGVPGGVTTGMARMRATVTAINYDTRSLTLVNSSGKSSTMTVGPEAVNFNQIKIGDIVMVESVEEVAIFLRNKAEPKNDGATALLEQAEEGKKPAGIVATSAEVTAVVTTLDLLQHTATLKFPDGSQRVVQVRDDIDLSKHKAGEEVVIQSTKMLAISVESP